MSDASSTTVIRPGFVYRSGDLSSITPEGIQAIKCLGIKKIFDMRSDPELIKYSSGDLPQIAGTEIISAPVFKSEDYSPEQMAKRYKLYASGKTEAFMQLYTQIMDSGGPAFGTILRHIRDNPTEPCLFHCTAGKDRTGVLAALILRLMNASDDAITNDYALTRIGREPARERSITRLAREPMFAEAPEAMLNMLSCRAETMTAFLHVLDEEYGGAEGYLRSHCNFTEDDINLVRHNLAPSFSSNDLNT